MHHLIHLNCWIRLRYGHWDLLLQTLVSGTLNDDATIDLADKLREHGISTPDEIGYEMTDQYGEVVAEIELAWINKKIGFMTDDKIDHRRKAEEKGWKILDTADEIISALGA